MKTGPYFLAIVPKVAFSAGFDASVSSLELDEAVLVESRRWYRADCCCLCLSSGSRLTKDTGYFDVPPPLSLRPSRFHDGSWLASDGTFA